jgi:hypothetical protein
MRIAIAAFSRASAKGTLIALPQPWSSAYIAERHASNDQGFGFDTRSLEHAFTKRKGKPVKRHSTFHVTK